MKSRTSREAMLALCGGGDVDQRLEVLSSLVVDLLVEVEALRGALIGSADGEEDSIHSSKLAPGKSGYAASYAEASYELHNSAGPSPGVEKLLRRFYPARGDEAREAIMLRRLGYSEPEIARLIQRMQDAELFS